MDSTTRTTLTVLAEAHHLATLDRIDPTSLSSGHPLDYPTHMALREIHRHRTDDLHDFLTRSDTRADLLNHAIDRLRRHDYEPLTQHAITPAAATSDPQAGIDAAQQLLPGAASGTVDGGSAIWANPRSFALFDPTGPATIRHGHPFQPATEIAASSYGRGYYAFSLPDPHGGFWLQPAAITVVAAVYAWLAETSPPPAGLTATQQLGITRLKTLHQQDGHPGFEALLTAMITTHEVGHTLHLDGQAPLADLLERTGHDPTAAFHHGFPSHHQLQAWHRLRAGAASTSDITFVLGDALANTTCALTTTPGDPVSTLRTAYLWQIISPPRVDRAPRGLAISLRAEERLDLPGLLDELADTLRAAHHNPATVARRIQALEQHSWDLLRHHTTLP